MPGRLPRPQGPQGTFCSSSSSSIAQPLTNPMPRTAPCPALRARRRPVASVGGIVQVGVRFPDNLWQLRRVLPWAVPAARRIAQTVGGVGEPLLGLLGDLLDLVHADLAVPRLVHLLPVVLVDVHPGAHPVLHHLVDYRLGGAGHGGAALVIEAKGMAEGVVRADVRVNAVADAGDMWQLSEVVAAAARPDKHVVSEMADEAVGLLLVRGEAARNEGDVLQVPGIAVCQRGAVGNARDLVPIVPPRQHARVLGGVLPYPVVAVEVVCDDDALARLQLRLEDDAGLRGHLRKHVGELEERAEVQWGGAQQQQGSGHPHHLPHLAVVGRRQLLGKQ
mmetsp:Transcript_19776/g.54934  ORF Transcript_19776/g.54934 Transcript_19776/m.54934 type:complete len:334 (+) Transcript_19776:296-1297(+)